MLAAVCSIKKTGCCANSAPPFQHRLGRTSRQSVTEPERFCPYTDLLLPFQEEILPHRCICQANKDSPPGAACQEREFRTGNRLLQPLSARPVEEVERTWSLPVEYLWAEQGHSD